jgi:hypothetical protein
MVQAPNSLNFIFFEEMSVSELKRQREELDQKIKKAELLEGPDLIVTCGTNRFKIARTKLIDFVTKETNNVTVIRDPNDILPTDVELKTFDDLKCSVCKQSEIRLWRKYGIINLSLKKLRNTRKTKRFNESFTAPFFFLSTLSAQETNWESNRRYQSLEHFKTQFGTCLDHLVGACHELVFNKETKRITISFRNKELLLWRLEILTRVAKQAELLF